MNSDLQNAHQASADPRAEGRGADWLYKTATIVAALLLLFTAAI